jgi:CRISPR-associated protein Csd1
MILKALYDLAGQEQLVADPDFPLAPVTWLVTVSADGRISGVADTRVEVQGTGKKPKLIAKSFPIPYQSGRSGTKAPAYFLVDNAKYVFGHVTADKNFAKREGVEKSEWFRQRVNDCVAATADAGAQAVLKALESVARGEQETPLPTDARSNDLIGFVFEPDLDLLVHMRPAVQAYWRDLRLAEASAQSPADEPTFECIVTGKPVRSPGLFPKVKHVPGGQTSGSPLVSFNASAFTSYGLDSNENAPIAREVAEACATALQRLLHPAFPDPRPQFRDQVMARRNYRLSDDAVACFWSDVGAASPFLDAFPGLFESDPAMVADMFRSVWRGRPAPVPESASFFVLILGGAQGRIIVRDWFTTSAADASRHLARHFAGLTIVRNTPPRRDGTVQEAFPLRVLLSSLAPFGRTDAIPPAVAAEVFSAALRGTQYPISLLQRAIERSRAEVGYSDWADLERRDARASLIKAVLNRRRQSHSSYPEITVALDPSNTNPGYLCGRLMAIVERLQQAALGDVNATVVDRFFGAASATPRAVFTRLLRGARHHARKAGDEQAKPGLARMLEGQLDAICVHFDPKNNGFPAFLDLEQQGLFMLGYHQQRHEFWKKREPPGPIESESPTVAGRPRPTAITASNASSSAA